MASATGFNKYDVKTEYFEVSKWKQKARFELVDRKKGNFGFIAVGNIVQKMKPTFKKRSNVSFNVPAEFDVDLYAGSDLVRNPVSISIDGKGRVYAAEVHRFQKGVEDSRRFNAWFLDDKNKFIARSLGFIRKMDCKRTFKEGHFHSNTQIKLRHWKIPMAMAKQIKVQVMRMASMGLLREMPVAFF